MLGMINRSIQCFLRDTYGEEIWRSIADRAAIGFENFEALMPYEDDLTLTIIGAASAQLQKPTESIFEDLGTYLVSHPNNERIRRLLRFGGDTFLDFLHSLDELEGRAKLAVPELALPQLELRDHQLGNFTLLCSFPICGSGHVMVGVLRAMADDYGTLALLENLGGNRAIDTIEIKLLEVDFAKGRSFALSTVAA